MNAGLEVSACSRQKSVRSSVPNAKPWTVICMLHQHSMTLGFDRSPFGDRAYRIMRHDLRSNRRFAKIRLLIEAQDLPMHAENARK